MRELAKWGGKEGLEMGGFCPRNGSALPNGWRKGRSSRLALWAPGLRGAAQIGLGPDGDCLPPVPGLQGAATCGVGMGAAGEDDLFDLVYVVGGVLCAAEGAADIEHGGLLGVEPLGARGAGLPGGRAADLDSPPHDPPPPPRHAHGRHRLPEGVVRLVFRLGWAPTRVQEIVQDGGLGRRVARQPVGEGRARNGGEIGDETSRDGYTAPQDIGVVAELRKQLPDGPAIRGLADLLHAEGVEEPRPHSPIPALIAIPITCPMMAMTCPQSTGALLSWMVRRTIRSTTPICWSNWPN